MLNASSREPLDGENHETAVEPIPAAGLVGYKALLWLYPHSFRREFASDMIQDFEEASQEAWTNGRWHGLLSLWFFTGTDVVRSVPMQWFRSPALFAGVLALVSATSCAAAVGVLDPRVPYTMKSSTPERDGVLLLILVTTTVVVIAATVIFSLIFLRPALDRSQGGRRV